MFRRPVNATNAVGKCIICMNFVFTNPARPNNCCHVFHFKCIYRWAVEGEGAKAYIIKGPGTTTRPNCGTPQVKFLPGVHCPICRTIFFEIIRVMDFYTKKQRKYMNTRRPFKLSHDAKGMLSVKDPRYISKMRSFDAKNAASSSIDQVVVIDDNCVGVSTEGIESFQIQDVKTVSLPYVNYMDDTESVPSVHAPDPDYEFHESELDEEDQVYGRKLGTREISTLNSINSQQIDLQILDQLDHYVIPTINDNPIALESNESQQEPPQADSDSTPTPTTSSSNVCSVKIVAHLHCFECNKTFNSTAAKSMHSQRHKKIDLKCSVCNKKYSTRSNLAQHKRKNH